MKTRISYYPDNSFETALSRGVNSSWKQ